jgi:uncharacterized membrane protein YgdD (TMEM256/DUF423 family)
VNVVQRLAALGAVSGFISVAAGAFGAHGLQKLVTPQRQAQFDTGARYEMYHALALFAAAWAAERLSEKWGARAGVCFVVGTVLFSFSLYALVLLEQPWLGRITPIGGLAFLAGWICLLIASCTSK